MSDDFKSIENHLNSLDLKLGLISEKLHSIDLTLGKQEVVLKDHVRRTLNLEKRIVPLEKSTVRWAAVAKIASALAAVATAGTVIFKLIG